MAIRLSKVSAFLFVNALALSLGVPSAPAPASAQPGGSFAPYLDLLKKDKSGGVKWSAIYGFDGGKWAATADAKPGEIAALVAGLKDPSKFQANGIVFNGTKYMFLTTRSPAGVIGRKGPNSILLRTTLNAILIIVTTDGANPANITSIDFVADDFKKKKF